MSCPVYRDFLFSNEQLEQMKAMKKFFCCVLLFVMIAGLASCSDSDTETYKESFGISTEQNIVFQGSNADITYIGLSDAPGMSGCLYLSLEIENTGSSECVYTLADVYVNDYSCNTGSGVPVVAKAGKSVTGAFIVFTDLKIDDISSIEFCVEIRDNKTFLILETSDTISVVISE